jgi:hypothetical protein
MIGTDWNRMAIDSLFSRGELPDWREFAEALAAEPKIAESALIIGTRHEDTGSAALARILVGRFHPEVLKRFEGGRLSDLQVPSLGSLD